MGNICNQFLDFFPLRIYASHRKFRCRQILRQTVFQRRLPRLIKCGLGKGAVYRRLKHIGKSIHHLFLPVSEEKCCCKHTPCRKQYNYKISDHTSHTYPIPYTVRICSFACNLSRSRKRVFIHVHRAIGPDAIHQSFPRHGHPRMLHKKCQKFLLGFT